ncbi:oligosaccharide flippase family protein [Paraglaciecola chathamensis]|uniref:oligosaccharide flippase family protein n=1 Tax=Paraglaciecola chathamensis TaxID=368405 RepID=UPI00270487B4|nr:oligosaccharide flippase family protein [Paraglaciecola chathamensis]MDO6838786.1 oligosaccharide flippase family protein [Paraglaciecola chathamensis]
MSVLSTRLNRLFWVFFEKFGLIGLSIISFLVYAKYLTPAELGLGILLMSMIEFWGMFLIAIVDSSMIRLKEITQENDGTTFWLLLIVSTLLAALTFGGYYLYFDDPVALWAGAIAVLYLPIQSVTRLHIVHLRRKKSFKKLANRTIFGKVCGMTVGIWLAMSGFGAFAVVSQSTVMAFVSTTFLLYFERRALPLIIDFKWAKEQFIVGFPASIKVTNLNLYTKGTIFVIESFLGTAAVGFYNFANRLVELPRAAIVTSLMGYAHPVFAAKRNRGESLETFYLLSTKIALLVIMPMFVGLALIAEPLILELFEEKWLPSVDILAGIAVLTAFNMYFMFLPSVLVAAGQTRHGLKGQIFSSILALSVLALTIDDLGLIAVLYALATRVATVIVVNFYAMSKVLVDIKNSFIKSCAFSTLASISMWITTKLVMQLITLNNNWLEMGVCVFVASLTYCCTYFLLDRKIVSEIKTFFSK